MAVLYNPLPVWPHPTNAGGRRESQFKAPYDQTVRELEYEVELLQRRDQPLVITISAGYRAGDVRRDGQPRADARAPMHPGVEVSFDSRHGRLTYATDIFWDWRDNVRAIAKGLEALRAIERWGVASRGQQYAGFAQLTAGGADPERGRMLVDRIGSVAAALRATHPDTRNGDYTDRDFADVQAYRQIAEVTTR